MLAKVVSKSVDKSKRFFVVQGVSIQFVMGCIDDVMLYHCIELPVFL